MSVKYKVEMTLAADKTNRISPGAVHGMIQRVMYDEAKDGTYPGLHVQAAGFKVTEVVPPKPSSVTVYKGARWSSDDWCDHILIRLSTDAWILAGSTDGEAWERDTYTGVEGALEALRESEAGWTLINAGLYTARENAEWEGKVNL